MYEVFQETKIGPFSRGRKSIDRIEDGATVDLTNDLSRIELEENDGALTIRWLEGQPVKVESAAVSEKGRPKTTVWLDENHPEIGTGRPDIVITSLKGRKRLVLKGERTPPLALSKEEEQLVASGIVLLSLAAARRNSRRAADQQPLRPSTG